MRSGDWASCCLVGGWRFGGWPVVGGKDCFSLGATGCQITGAGPDPGAGAGSSFHWGAAGWLGWIELPQGLQLLQTPLMLGASGLVLGVEEQERLLANMGDCEAMILRNHGLLTVGRSVGEAFNNMYRVERSCRSQLMAMACNDKIVIPPQDIIEKTNHMYRPGTRRPYGVLEWPAMRRMADRIDPSYKN